MNGVGVRPLSLMSNSVFFENRELADQFAVGASRVRLEVDFAPACGAPDRLDSEQNLLKSQKL
jgi:hypothetical protein